MAAVPSTGRASEVEREAAPEADATSALYERYAGQLYGFCLNRLGSREEAEDAVQTTFLNAFRGLRRGVVPEIESAWLFKIAENVCLTRHRSAWRRGRVESPSDMQALQDVTPAREAGGGEELIPLGDALAAMPETQRRAILLREWQGLSYREIATELDVSQSAVETLIFRARRSLANALETPWQERRAAGKAGRRAFDLGSLLAALKTLFAGGTAAKVAAVAAVAATGTAALAVAENRHPSPSTRVEPKVAAARVPDSAAPLGAVAGEPRVPAAERVLFALSAAPATKPKRGEKPSREEAPAGAKRSAHATPAASDESADRAKEPRGRATAPGQASRAEQKTKLKPKKPKAKSKAKAKHKAAPPKPKPAPKAAPARASQPKAAAPTPPPPPAAPPSEKDKEKKAGE